MISLLAHFLANTFLTTTSLPPPSAIDSSVQQQLNQAVCAKLVYWSVSQRFIPIAIAVRDKVGSSKLKSLCSATLIAESLHDIGTFIANQRKIHASITEETMWRDLAKTWQTIAADTFKRTKDILNATLIQESVVEQAISEGIEDARDILASLSQGVVTPTEKGIDRIWAIWSLASPYSHKTQWHP